MALNKNAARELRLIAIEKSPNIFVNLTANPMMKARTPNTKKRVRNLVFVNQFFIDLKNDFTFPPSVNAANIAYCKI